MNYYLQLGTLLQRCTFYSIFQSSSKHRFRRGVDQQYRIRKIWHDLDNKSITTNLSRNDFLINLNRLISEKWRVTSSHFVHEHAKSPPINCFVVPLKPLKEMLILSDERLPIKKLISQMNYFTLLRIISGAKYSGVPHSVHVLPLTRLANPKSVT